MRTGRRFVLRGGRWVVGLIAVVVMGACGSARQEPDIPVFEMVLTDAIGSVPEFTAEDSAAIERLENGEGPVRLRMVMCDEVLVDEVVSNTDELGEVMDRQVLEMFEENEESVDEILAELQAMDPDSIAAAWEASWEAMTPAERDEFNAEMERLMPMLGTVLGETSADEPDLEALQETLDTLNRMYPDLQVSWCEEWRKLRAELRKKAGEKENGRGEGPG